MPSSASTSTLSLAEVSFNLHFCPFYNNGKYCPYENIGCKFKHEVSKMCKFDKTCVKKLCQFKHSLRVQNSRENQNEIIDNEIEKVDDYRKYDTMSENDQFDVYQEICMNICWGGFHKCVEHDEDNELLGVNVQRLNDDFQNRREEEYQCEKCNFCSKDMEAVKEHFLKQHRKSYSCWECNKQKDSKSITDHTITAQKITHVKSLFF